MLITFIVTAAVLAVLYLLTNVFYKKSDRSQYDYVTAPSKPYLILVHTVFGVGMSILALDIVLYFFWNDVTGLWCIYGMALLLAFIGLLMFCGLCFTYEAIKGNYVYVRRLFTTKIIKVCDIRNVEIVVRAGLAFYDRYNKVLFYADSATQGIYVLIGLINERKADIVKEDPEQEEIYSEEGKALLLEMGQEYRANYNKHRKKFILISLTVGMTIVVILGIIFALVSDDVNTAVFLGVLCALAVIIFVVAVSIAKGRELSKDDFSLGEVHKYDNKKVKGASKDKFKKMRIYCLPVIILGAIVAVIMTVVWALGPKEYSYDEYAPLTGKIEYCREQPGRYNYIAIGLEDVPTEYRLTSIFLRELDYSFFNEVKAGDTVTIYVDTSDDRSFSMRGVSKKKFNSFYYLEANGKEYFTYEDFVTSHKRNDAIGVMIAAIGIAAGVASAAALIITYVICKKREKYEEIEIYYNKNGMTQQ